MQKIKIKILLLILSLSFLFVSSLKSAVWEPVSYNFNYPFVTILYDMAVLDSNNAYAVLFGQGSPRVVSLRHSIDGGETWHEIYVKEQNLDVNYWIPEELQVPAPNHIFLRTERNMTYNTLSNNRIRHSRDNGLTWDTLLIINEYVSDGRIRNLTMYDSLVGLVSNTFCVSHEGLEYDIVDLPIITVDGWQTAKILRPDLFFNEYLNIITIHFFSQKHFGFWSGGLGFDIPGEAPVSPYFYWTEDGGETWERSNPFYDIEGYLTATNRDPSFPCLYFVNDTLGWMVGGRIRSDIPNAGITSTDVIMKTTDGGRTWKLNYLQDNTPMMGLRDISCKDEMNCVAVGNWGKVLRTTDGGETWVQEYSEDFNMKLGKRLRMRVAYLGSKPIIGSSPSDPMFWREKTTSILEPLLTSSSQVYPNPVATGKNLTAEIMCYVSDISTVELGLYDFMGQKVLDLSNHFEYEQATRTIRTTFDIPKSLAKGSYFLVVRSGKETRTKGIIVK